MSGGTATDTIHYGRAQPVVNDGAQAVPVPRRSWLTLFQGARPFNRAGAIRDARIAGTPVVTGIYTLLFPLVAFAAFGSSRYLVVAADSATAAIVAGGVSLMAPVASARYVALTGLV